MKKILLIKRVGDGLKFWELGQESDEWKPTRIVYNNTLDVEMEDIPEEFAKVINEDFWEII